MRIYTNSSLQWTLVYPLSVVLVLAYILNGIVDLALSVFKLFPFAQGRTVLKRFFPIARGLTVLRLGYARYSGSYIHYISVGISCVASV